MSHLLRSLFGRLLGRRRAAVGAPAAERAGPPQVDIVLSDLPPDWVHSLESADPPTDYDVHSLGEPIDPPTRR